MGINCSHKEYFSGHVGNNAEDYKDQHEGYPNGVKNKEEKSLWSYENDSRV